MEKHSLFSGLPNKSLSILMAFKLVFRAPVATIPSIAGLLQVWFVFETGS